MSAPVTRGEQRRLSVIRVDLDSPYIDGGFDGAMKWVTRTYKAASTGINIKIVAAKERVLNAISSMNKGEIRGFTMLDNHAKARTVGLKMDEVMNRLKELIVLALPPPNVYQLSTYVASVPNGEYNREYLDGIGDLNARIWETIERHISAKFEEAWGKLLVALYNEYVALYVKVHLQPAQAANAFMPMAMYRPVLLCMQ